MSRLNKKKPPICILIARETPPENEAQLASEIDRLADRFNQPVKSIGMMAIRIGLADVEKGFRQMLEK